MDHPCDQMPSTPRPLMIGPVGLATPLLMAPMAGFTDWAFRQVVRRLGGCGLPVTEMVSARGMLEMDRRERALPERLWGAADEPRPLAVQIWDNDPVLLAEIADRLVRQFAPTVIDLNFGCPAPDVAGKAESGAYLLRFPDRIGRIVERVAAACGSTPVTAKVRLGPDRRQITIFDVAQAVEAAGGAAITVHGRTAADFYRGKADWELIAQTKSVLRRIPLIGNGDLATADDIVAAFRRYPVDGVMIGRAALNDPWLFAQGWAALQNRPLAPPTPADRCAGLLEHLQLRLTQYGPDRALGQMRKVAACYTHGLPGARAFRQGLNQLQSIAEFRLAVERFFASQPTDDNVLKARGESPLKAAE